MIKNPNWQEATMLLFTKHGGVESGTTGNKSLPEVRARFEPGKLHANSMHSASLVTH